MTVDDLARLPRRSVQAKAHDGKETSFDGVELGDVLKLAGVKFGEELRGKDLTLFLVVDAADGYRAVFALPELDHAFSDRIVILADRRDGKPLAAKEGPLRIVVPDEKREARWVRQVITFTIRRAEQALWTEGHSLSKQKMNFLRNIVTARNTKNGRPRDIPMNDDVRNALAKLCKDKRPEDYVFVSPKTRSCLREVKRGFHTACRLAGIEGLIWKDLRATFGTRLA